MSNAESVIVAIDGPSASGKSTVSRRVAEALGFTYVDSGSLYRGVTWKALREGVGTRDAERVMEMLGRVDLRFHVQDRAVGFTMDGEEPGPQLRSEPVRESVSDVAAMPGVRAFVVDRLRGMARYGRIVMEGRDIGSVVFPDTPFKFYLDADPEERARRRFRELQQAEGEGSVSQVLDSLRRRDQKDSHRKTAPLQIPLGATVIDSTSMTVDEVVARIVSCVRGAGRAP